MDSLLGEGGYEGVHKVHPAILKLGVHFTDGTVSGASARSLAMLQAFHHLIQVRCSLKCSFNSSLQYRLCAGPWHHVVDDR